MKIVSSYSAMFCSMFMIVAFFTTTCKSCELDYKLRPFGCPEYKRVYLIYKKVESMVTNSTETLPTCANCSSKTQNSIASKELQITKAVLENDTPT